MQERSLPKRHRGPKDAMNEKVKAYVCGHQDRG